MGVNVSNTLFRQLREQAGLSQGEIAKFLGITRQTYIKYESMAGDPPLSVLRKLSEYYEVDPGCFVTGRLPEEYHYGEKDEGVWEAAEDEPSNDMRIDIPQRRVEKFKQVLLYILCQVGAWPNVGETVLYKLLYFIDFDYYELYEEQLMGLSYIRNTYGPTPVDFTKLTADMEADGLLEKAETQYFNRRMKKYLPRVEADLSLLNGRELRHIDNILKKHAHKSARELSDLSHKDIPWIGTPERQPIPYESVFYRTPDTSVRVYDGE